MQHRDRVALKLSLTSMAHAVCWLQQQGCVSLEVHRLIVKFAFLNPLPSTSWCTFKVTTGLGVILAWCGTGRAASAHSVRWF